MRPETRKLLHDMLDAATAIRAYADAHSIDDFASGDRLVRGGIYFHFMIIGEALKEIARIDPAVAASITDAHRIKSFRNLIVHGYGRLNDGLTWDTAKRGLPVVLIAEVDALLAT